MLLTFAGWFLALAVFELGLGLLVGRFLSLASTPPLPQVEEQRKAETSNARLRPADNQEERVLDWFRDTALPVQGGGAR